eukprot:CAMPEP_0183430612 /NCGR_PEP_ID=MMETSP0370-20130417/52288_1 /TAXON_ID=268820 /ORGANISM="Peridinium aciculiferum, Strain PAER-2" /LENGTH=49 /DNA_ID= /DNA_START= /DNA_END= /DNA_ORIENTATION=
MAAALHCSQALQVVGVDLVAEGILVELVRHGEAQLILAAALVAASPGEV